jgi:hypothetical protein
VEVVQKVKFLNNSIITPVFYLQMISKIFCPHYNRPPPWTAGGVGSMPLREFAGAVRSTVPAFQEMSGTFCVTLIILILHK